MEKVKHLKQVSELKWLYVQATHKGYIWTKKVQK